MVNHDKGEGPRHNGPMITLSLKKMGAKLDTPVSYFFSLGPDSKEIIELNSYLGKSLNLEFTGNIFCTSCQRKIKKTFSEGYCFPCSQKLAACDMCIVRPELCHYHLGTCREPSWGEKHCLQPHYVYLANSSGLKVGITRLVNVPTRWIDQGATQALPVLKVQTRLQSGVIEKRLSSLFADKTNWQKMLKNEVVEIDLEEKRQELYQEAEEILEDFVFQFGEENLELLEKELPIKITYPVLEYPKKVKSLSLDKTPRLQGTLLGIKGQYLIFDIGVLNIRKFTGHEICLSA